MLHMAPLEGPLRTTDALFLEFMSSSGSGDHSGGNHNNENQKTTTPAAASSGLGDSIFSAIEQQQRDQLTHQQILQLQQQLGGGNVSEVKAEGNEQANALVPVPPAVIEPNQQPPTMVASSNPLQSSSALKRQAEHALGDSSGGQPDLKRAHREHENTDMFVLPQQPQPQDSSTSAQPSVSSLSLLNNTSSLGPNVALEPTPLLGNNFATGGATPLTNMDLMMLRDLQQQASTAAAAGPFSAASSGPDVTGPTFPGVTSATSLLSNPSSLALAEQLRLSAAASAENSSSQLLQETSNMASSAAGSGGSLPSAAQSLLGTLAAGQLDPFFGATASATTATGQGSNLFTNQPAAASTAAAPTTAGGMMFPAFAGLLDPAASQMLGATATVPPTSDAASAAAQTLMAPQVASLSAASAATDTSDLGLMMRQLAAFQNPAAAGSSSAALLGLGGGGGFGGVPVPAGAPASSQFPSSSSPPAPDLSAQEGRSSEAKLPAAVANPEANTVVGSADRVASSTRAISMPLIVGSEPGVVVDPSLPRGLPPLEESGTLEHFSKRSMFCLGIDEDPNWLSEFHCFVRRELTEVCRANKEDCKARNNSINFCQVGIRCRFCAHKPNNNRAGRSSAFPSSLRQIYQSFTMMLREHFPNCDCVPEDLREEFNSLKDTPSQGATDSKRYWMYSAMKLGLNDSSDGEGGIVCTEESVGAGAKAAPFGTNTENRSWPDEATKSVSLVLPMDRDLKMEEFLYVLLGHCQVVKLHESERIGNRRSLKLGLPGIACRFCCQARRLGLCRLFPARRRTLPQKLNDMYDHLRRCTLVPKSTKDQMEQLKKNMREESLSDRENAKEFFDRVWVRMGHAKAATMVGLAQQQPAPFG